VAAQFEELLSKPLEVSSAAGLDDGGWGAAFEQAAATAEKEAQTEVKVEIAPVGFVPLSGTQTSVAITIQTPDLMDRVPVDVACVIDISGSMSSEAMFQDPDNESQQIGSGTPRF
jgi:hypothetical protein